MKTLFVLPLLFASAEASAGAVAPPSEPFDARTWSATMKQKPTTGVTLGNWPVNFEKTTLPEVLARASAGAIEHAGEAGDSVYWLCYTLTGQLPSRLWIASHGEMGGPKRAITGITIAAIDSTQPAAGCPALPIHLQPASVQGKVRLGMGEPALAKALGAPSHRSGEWISYDFEGKMQGKCPGGFDVLNSLVLKTKHGRVEAIHASQVTSC